MQGLPSQLTAAGALARLWFRNGIIVSDHYKGVPFSTTMIMSCLRQTDERLTRLVAWIESNLQKNSAPKSTHENPSKPGDNQDEEIMGGSGYGKDDTPERRPRIEFHDDQSDLPDEQPNGASRETGVRLYAFGYETNTAVLTLKVIDYDTPSCLFVHCTRGILHNGEIVPRVIKFVLFKGELDNRFELILDVVKKMPQNCITLSTSDNFSDLEIEYTRALRVNTSWSYYNVNEKVRVCLSCPLNAFAFCNEVADRIDRFGDIVAKCTELNNELETGRVSAMPGTGMQNLPPRGAYPVSKE
jgi:hypothetical protein